jgi:hypothetical protein
MQAYLSYGRAYRLRGTVQPDLDTLAFALFGCYWQFYQRKKAVEKIEYLHNQAMDLAEKARVS